MRKTLLLNTSPVLRRTLGMKVKTKFMDHILVSLPDQLLDGRRTGSLGAGFDFFVLYQRDELKLLYAWRLWLWVPSALIRAALYMRTKNKLPMHNRQISIIAIYGSFIFQRPEIVDVELIHKF